MSDMQMDANDAIAGLLDQVAVLSKEKAMIQLHLNAALKELLNYQNQEATDIDDSNAI
jgi:hypothetical protein